MGKKLFITDIKDNTHVEDLFLVKEKNNAVTKNGKPYLALALADRTGIVKGRVWEDAEKLSSLFSQGDIVRLRANALLYQGELQLNITAIVRYADDAVRLQDFLPSSPHDLEQSFRELMSLVETIQNSHLRTLLGIIFDDQQIAAAFKAVPAARSIHHDYLGGLLDHTLMVARLAMDVSRHYRNVDRDILMAGAVLHDIGKIYELSYERNFEYTDAGRLIGHILLGVELIDHKLQQLPDFPADVAAVLKHLIISHHGQYEFGSPKRPKTLEALMLSYLDDVDAKMYGLAQFIRKERQPEVRWTSFYRLFDRYIYTGTFLDDAGGSPEKSGEDSPE